MLQDCRISCCNRPTGKSGVPLHGDPLAPPAAELGVRLMEGCGTKRSVYRGLVVWTPPFLFSKELEDSSMRMTLRLYLASFLAVFSVLAAVGSLSAADDEPVSGVFKGNGALLNPSAV